MRSGFLSSLVLGVCALPSARLMAATRHLVPNRVDPGVIFVDGVLDEAEWGEAPIASEFVQNDPREGEPATFETEVRILYDDENL
ncbi:MAG TPA: hypothetical protein VEK15_10235, partial [Vicinamibacteria bacterium]|nr:hypothetical protein [Vicinamibacteria bacterium]